MRNNELYGMAYLWLLHEVKNYYTICKIASLQKQICKTNKMFCNYGATTSKQVRGKQTCKSVANNKFVHGKQTNKFVHGKQTNKSVANNKSVHGKQTNKSVASKQDYSTCSHACS